MPRGSVPKKGWKKRRPWLPKRRALGSREGRKTVSLVVKKEEVIRPEMILSGEGDNLMGKRADLGKISHNRGDEGGKEIQAERNFLSPKE